MAFITLISGVRSISPTKIVPMKFFRISTPITTTLVFTRSKLSIKSSLMTKIQKFYNPTQKHTTKPNSYLGQILESSISNVPS